MTRILVVEDEESFSDALSYMLRKEGFEATVVTDAPSALAEFERAGADIVLLDLVLIALFAAFLYSYFIVTIVVSLMTKPRDERELVGLVYSLTERPKDDGGVWYNRPLTIGIAVLLLTAALNFLFW